jgi:hypothetical protein
VHSFAWADFLDDTFANEDSGVGNLGARSQSAAGAEQLNVSHGQSGILAESRDLSKANANIGGGVN